MRVLVDNDAKVTSPTFTNADEEPADTASLATVAITEWDGTSIGSNPTATNETPAGVYSAILSGATHCADLNLLTLTWSGTVSSRTRSLAQQVEVVGGHYATIPELRALDGLGDTGTYPTADLIGARDEFARIVEDYLGVSYVPRLRVERLVGNGRARLLLGRQQVRAIRSVTIGGTSISTASIGYSPAGWIEYDGGFTGPLTAGPNVVVAYEHGHDAPTDNLRLACQQYVRSSLLRRTSKMGRDVLSEGAEGVRYSTANKDQRRPTGWEEVDRRLNDEPDARVPA